jgi:hypothetical protein
MECYIAGMAKLSIYLPDDVESRVRAAQPGTAISQVIRMALERYVGNDDSLDYVQPPADADELLATAVTHFTGLARQDYQNGYRAALKRLPDLKWHILAGYAGDGFDLHKWLRGWKENISHLASQNRFPDVSKEILKIADDVGDLLNPIGFDEWSFRRTPPWLHGYGDGLRAGYEAALSSGAFSGGQSRVAAPGTERDRDAEAIED